MSWSLRTVIFKQICCKLCAYLFTRTNTSYIQKALDNVPKKLTEVCCIRRWKIYPFLANVKSLAIAFKINKKYNDF